MAAPKLDIDNLSQENSYTIVQTISNIDVLCTVCVCVYTIKYEEYHTMVLYFVYYTQLYGSLFIPAVPYKTHNFIIYWKKFAGVW